MLNRAEVIGRLTRDPELRFTPNGTPVCHLALATNEIVGSGESREERTEFHDVTTWDTLAEPARSTSPRGGWSSSRAACTPSGGSATPSRSGER